MRMQVNWTKDSFSRNFNSKIVTKAKNTVQVTSSQALIPFMFHEANFLFHNFPSDVFASDLKSSADTSGIAALLFLKL